MNQAELFERLGLLDVSVCLLRRDDDVWLVIDETNRARKLFPELNTSGDIPLAHLLGDDSSILGALSDATESGMPTSHEIDVGGAIVDVVFQLLDDPDAEVDAVCMFRDRARLHEVENRLERSEKLLKSIYDSAEIGMCLTDKRGHYVNFNNAYEQMYGYSREELIGKHFSIVLPPETREIGRAAHDAFIAGDVEEAGEWEVRRKDGSEFTAYVTAGLLDLGEGERFKVTTLVDVTERRREQEYYAKLRERMRHAHKLESLGLLAAGIAHDFNNFLTAVLGNAALLKHDLDTDSPAHAIVADIENAAESATGLSRRLLDYTNPESKEAEQIDLANVVEEIISMVRGTIPPWIDLQSEVKSGEYFTTGDEMQLRQVVMNLVTNGLEAMEQSERGQLRVSVGRQTLVAQQLDAFDLSTAEPGPHVFVEVEDTGYGLSSEAREKLFDPFYTTKTEGRGFGMAIVSSIISAHSGAIKIDSTSSTGTRVRAVFPESLDQDASQFTPTDPDKPFVLVVDDDRFVRATLERLLRRIGYPSLVFERGAAAIDAVRRNEGRVRLLLLDLTIPGESARDTLKQVRAIGSDVRVVVTSGHEMSVVRERLEGVSFDAFLPKPFKATRLEEILGEFASESSQS